MASFNPTGMGSNTSRRFRQVADDIMKYANSVHEYNGSSLIDYEWYDSHGTIRNSFVQHTGTFYASQSPRFYPTFRSMPSSTITGRRDRRKTSW